MGKMDGRLWAGHGERRRAYRRLRSGACLVDRGFVSRNRPQDDFVRQTQASGEPFLKVWETALITPAPIRTRPPTMIQVWGTCSSRAPYSSPATSTMNPNT